MTNDRISITDFIKGDVSAFKALFESFYGSLCQITNKYLKDDAASRDIAQDAFVYLWEKRAEINSVQSAKFYLYKFVKNRSLNYIRDARHRSKINMQLQNPEASFRDDLIEQETYILIHKAIQGLTPQEQRIILLALDGLSNIQIAEELKISINTVKTLKKRAYKMLHDELKENIFVLFHLLKRN